MAVKSRGGQTPITPQQFRKMADQGKVKGVVLFVGDRGLVERAVDDAVNALVGTDDRELVVAAFHGDDIDDRRLLTEVRTMPMFADRRIVVVRQAQSFQIQDSKSPLAAYIQNPIDSTVLLFSAPDIDRRKRMFTLIKKHGIIVDCKKLDRRSAPLFVQSEADAQDKRIDTSAVAALVELVGVDAAMLSNEVCNLASYIGDRQTITEEDVLALTANLREENIFNMTDALASRNVGLALAALEHLLDDGASPVYVVSMMEWLLRRLYSARVAVDGGISPARAAEIAGVPPYFRDKFAGQVSRFSVAELVHLLDLLLDVDIGLRRTGATPRTAIELFVVKAASNRRVQAIY